MKNRSAPSLKRAPATRDPKARFVIFCEGKKTEPAYLDAVRRIYAGTLLSIKVVHGAGVPLTLAKTAIRHIKESGLSGRGRKNLNLFEANDQVWVVFDRDEHPQHSKAVALCKANGINIARSNPCFEIWLILHEADYDRPDDRHVAQAWLKRLRPEYDPLEHKWLDCTELVSRVHEAERRAELQLTRRASEGDPYGPPSTTMFLLTQAIRDASARADHISGTGTPRQRLGR